MQHPIRFFFGGILFFLIALCYINKKRVAMSVSPAHSCALFFCAGDRWTRRRQPDLGGVTRGTKYADPLCGRAGLGISETASPLWNRCGRPLVGGRAGKTCRRRVFLADAGEKKGHAGPAKPAGREGAGLRTARGAPAACRLRLCSQNEILCRHDTCEPSQTRYGCGAIACIFVVLREAYVGTGGSYVGTESKQFS